jgi:hypothetical protein
MMFLLKPKIEAEIIKELSQKSSHGLKELSNICELKIVKNSNYRMYKTRSDAVIDSIKELLFS